MLGLVCCLFVFYPVVWRLWEESGKRTHAAELTPVPFPSAESSMDFTVMSYNILADNLLLANLELYAHCPPEVLDWSHRSTLVLEEILKWAPDVRQAVLSVTLNCFRLRANVCFSRPDRVSPGGSGKPLSRLFLPSPVSER